MTTQFELSGEPASEPDLRVILQVSLIPRHWKACLTQDMVMSLRGVIDALGLQRGFDLAEYDGEADRVRFQVRAIWGAILSGLEKELRRVSARHMRREYGRCLAGHYWAPFSWKRRSFLELLLCPC